MKITNYSSDFNQLNNNSNLLCLDPNWRAKYLHSPQQLLLLIPNSKLMMLSTLVHVYQNTKDKKREQLGLRMTKLNNGEKYSPLGMKVWTNMDKNRL